MTSMVVEATQAAQTGTSGFWIIDTACQASSVPRTVQSVATPNKDLHLPQGLTVNVATGITRLIYLSLVMAIIQMILDVFAAIIM